MSQVVSYNFQRIVPPGTNVQFLQGDDGIPVGPDAGGIIYTPGAHGINTTNTAANTETIAIDNTIILGDLLPSIPQGTPTLTVQTGDIDVDAGQLNVTSSSVVDDFTGYNALLTDNSDNGIAARLFFKKTRNGNPVQVGNGLGTMRMSGFDGTQFTEAAIIQTIVDNGTVASGRVPGKINFYTHADAVTAPFGGPQIRMSIGSEGNVVIRSPVSGVGLTVQGGAADIVGVYNRAIIGPVQNVIVNAAGELATISSSNVQPLEWTVITLDQTAAVNNGYFCNKAGTLLLALPAASAVGDVIEVSNINTALGIQFTQGAGQQIFIGNTNTTLGAGGTLTSIAIGDALKIVCSAANLTWQVVGGWGNWTPA